MWKLFGSLIRYCSLLLLIYGLQLCNPAEAYVYLEPFLGYGIGSQSHPYIGVDDTIQNGESKAYGTSFGVRLGGQMDSWVAGVDLARSSYHFNISTPDVLVSTLAANGSLTENQFSTKEYAVFVSYLFPAIFRVWIAYSFSNTFTQNKGTVAQGRGEIRSGAGYKFGVGWMPHDFFSVNFEFKVVNLDTLEKSGQMYSTIEEARTAYILQFSLSTPINISLPY